MRKVFILLALVSLVVPVAADDPCTDTGEGGVGCSGDGGGGTIGQLLEGYLQPAYYVQYTQEPNWCHYSPADRVFIHYAQPFVPDRWYVVPASDPNSENLATEFHLIGAWSVDWHVTHYSHECGLFFLSP